MFTILKNTHIQKKYIIWLLILLAASALAEMMIPSLLAVMFDQGVGQNSEQILIWIGVVMAAMAILAALCSLAAVRLSAKISNSLAAQLRKKVFYQVQSFSSAEMDRFGTGSLITRSTADISNLQMFFMLLLQMGIMAPLMALAGLVLSSATGGKLSSVLLVSIPVLLITAALIVAAASRYSNKMRMLIDRMNQLFLENLEGVRVIRAFNREEHEVMRFKGVNDEFSLNALLAARVNGLLMPAIQFLFGMTLVVVMGMGAVMVGNGSLDVGVLSANVQYITMVMASALMLAAILMMLPMTLSCANRVREILTTSCSIHDGSMNTKADQSGNAVEFCNVSFSYPNASEPVLENISFAVKPGKTTAIIGRTGSGKSSLMKLIPRLYDVSAGHILVNGIDVREYNVNVLRDLIGYVPQKNVLFSGDIASNLNFGNPKGDEEAWSKACSIAEASEVVNKKEGKWAAPVAQMGTNFSGGQKQRLAIARALMKQAPVYLFDDSFSALDVKTDALLRSNLRHEMKDAAVIIIAQRISSIREADEILVLDQGKIVGRGTHSELLKTNEIYQEIARLQGMDGKERFR